MACLPLTWRQDLACLWDIGSIAEGPVQDVLNAKLAAAQRVLPQSLARA